MRTAEEKARLILKEWMPSAKKTPVELIAKVIQDQDRDTIHACAQTIASMPGEVMPGKNDLYISKDVAHSACMNVKAI